MSATNKVQLVGYVGTNPELVELKSGEYKKAIFSLATHEYYKKDEEWFNITTWHKLVGWGKTANKICDTIKKGTKVNITGRVSNRKVEGKQGSFTLSEITVSSIKLEPNK